LAGPLFTTYTNAGCLASPDGATKEVDAERLLDGVMLRVSEMLEDTDGDSDLLLEAPWDNDAVAESEVVGDTVRDTEIVRVRDGETETLAVVLRELVEDVPAMTQVELPGAQAVH
jgi:hypothetical protein